MVTYSHYSSTKKILKRVIIEHSIRLKKKTFQDSSISTKTFNSVKFHIILCKSIKCYKLFEEQKKTKKGILDTQKFLTNPT